MTFTLKTWTKLGLGAALASAALAACDAGEAGEAAEPATAEIAEAAGETGEGEGGEGEGGEGEGGVAIGAAATDPVVYGAAIAIAEAHVLAARDAHAAGETDAAAEMFAHPVSEVLADMEPVFAAQGVAPFNELFIDASGAALNGGSAEEIARRTDGILEALRAAAGQAPDNGLAGAQVAAGITADQVERAVDMYRLAATSGDYGPYLDGYGFYQAAKLTFGRDEAVIAADLPEAAGALRAALDALTAAYPDAGRQDALAADQGALALAVANVDLAISN